jgi:ubiquinone biosynthesis protein UbiJ
MLFESPFAAALNHLLQAEPWARERLAPFAGECVVLHAPLLPSLRFAIAADGTLAPAAPEATPALEIRLKPDGLAAAARGGDHLLHAVDVHGNAKLASEVMFLVRHLRWDVEEEASRWIGDIAAHRLVGLGREVAAWHADAARRLAEGLVEYALEEKRLLVRRGELDALAQAQARLRDGIERLEKRLAALAGR